MKQRLSDYTFNAIAKTVDLSAVANFDVRGLLAIINGASILFAAGSPGFALSSASGGVVTLGVQVSTAGMNDSDPLLVIYDDGAASASAANQAAEILALESIVTELASVAAVLAGTLKTSVVNLPATQPVSVSSVPTHAVTQGGGPWAVSGTFWQSVQPVSAASLPLPAGAAAAALQPALNADGGALAHVTNFPAVQTVSGSLVISNFPATQAVSGSVAVANLPATQAVTGSVNVSNFPATQPVSLSSVPTHAVTQSGGPWAVSGTFWQSVQPVSAASLPLPAGAAAAALQPALNADGGALAHVTNFPAVQAVAGSVAISNLPSTQPVSGAVSVSNLPPIQAVSGTIADSNSAAFQGAISMAVGTPQSPQRSIGVNCTAPGNISLTLADGSNIVVPVSAGFQTLPFAVTCVNASGTTAVAAYSNLK